MGTIAVEYAYPTSDCAKRAKRYHEGCWVVHDTSILPYADLAYADEERDAIDFAVSLVDSGQDEWDRFWLHIKARFGC